MKKKINWESITPKGLIELVKGAKSRKALAQGCAVISKDLVAHFTPACQRGSANAHNNLQLAKVMDYYSRTVAGGGGKPYEVPKGKGSSDLADAVNYITFGDLGFFTESYSHDMWVRRCEETLHSLDAFRGQSLKPNDSTNTRVAGLIIAVLEKQLEMEYGR